MRANTTITNDSERGAALVISLLSLALLLAMAMGISLTAISELGTSNTNSTQTVALQAAEAGLNHATSLIMNYQENTFTDLLRRRPIYAANPNFNSPLIEERHYITDNILGFNPFIPDNDDYFTSGVTMINYDDATRGCQMRDAITGAVVPDVFYRVSVVDDEPTTSTARVTVPNFIPGVTYRESVVPNAFDANTDKNNRLVIYSTGTYLNASVTLEGWVAFLPFPALSANGDINVTGSADIRGAYGGVHSNNNLAVDNAATIEQTATAVGTAAIANPSNVGGFSGGGQARLDIPPLVTNAPLSSGGPNTSPRLQDFLIQQADRLLIDPDYADSAHHNDPNGSGSGISPNATGRLRALAQRLNAKYETLAAAIDQDNDGGKVDQTEPVAIQFQRSDVYPYPFIRDPSTGERLAEKIDGGSSNNPADTGWSYNTSNGWNLSSTSASGHTYYVIGMDNYNLSNPSASTPNGGNVKITANSGSPGNPVRLTIMSTGSIEISGNPNIVSNLQGLRTPLLPPFVRIDVLMAAVEDLKINGDTDGAQRFSGISFAGEQVDLSGNGTFNGQVIAFNNRNVSGSPVNQESNTLTGSFELTLNDGNSIGRIRLYSWRQIKR